MKINYILYFFVKILFINSFTVAYTSNDKYPNDNDLCPYKIEKKQKLKESYEFSSTLSDICLEKLDEIIILKVSNFLLMDDMCILEQTSKRFSEILKNSYQYRSLIIDFKPEIGKEITLPITFSSKDKFLILKNKNPEFQIHFINLKRKFFPNFRFDLGLAYYTEKILTPLQLEKASKIYKQYWDENKQSLEKSEYVASSYLGFIQTENKRESYSETIIDLEKFLKNTHYSSQFHNEVRLELADFNFKKTEHEVAKKYYEAIINTSSDNNDEKWKAQLSLVKMDFPIVKMQNNKTQVLISREKIRSILNCVYVDPQTRMDTLYELAFSYTLEKEDLKANYLITSNLMEYILTSFALTEEHKIDIRCNLATLYLNKGDKIRDLNSSYILARKHYDIVFNYLAKSNFDSRKQAFLNLNFMDKQALDTADNKPNYKAIVERAEIYLNSRIESHVRAKIRLMLSKMYIEGEGCPNNIPDFKAARKHLNAMIKGSEKIHTPSQLKGEAQLMLTKINDLEQATEENHLKKCIS